MASPNEFFYTSDGKIRERSLTGGDVAAVEFNAPLQVTPSHYTRRKRDFDFTVRREALRIVRPVLSLDGKKVAFADVATSTR